MWPFRKSEAYRSIGAVVTRQGERMVVDVSGQTCPGYLLSINRECEKLAPGTAVSLVTSYAPCGADVEAWCREKGFTFQDTAISEGRWEIRIVV